MNKKLVKFILNIVLSLYATSLPINANAASADEIQVYDDAINKSGELNIDVHMNYVVSGIKDSAVGTQLKLPEICH